MKETFQKISRVFREETRTRHMEHQNKYSDPPYREDLVNYEMCNVLDKILESILTDSTD